MLFDKRRRRKDSKDASINKLKNNNWWAFRGEICEQHLVSSYNALESQFQLFSFDILVQCMLEGRLRFRLSGTSL